MPATAPVATAISSTRASARCTIVPAARADRARLTQPVYNVASFNPSAEEIRELVLQGFPELDISFEPDLKRQAIVDTWPADVDDTAARRDWGLAPSYDLDRAFSDYLIPGIRQRYAV